MGKAKEATKALDANMVDLPVYSFSSLDKICLLPVEARIKFQIRGGEVSFIFPSQLASSPVRYLAGSVSKFIMGIQGKAAKRASKGAAKAAKKAQQQESDRQKILEQVQKETASSTSAAQQAAAPPAKQGPAPNLPPADQEVSNESTASREDPAPASPPSDQTVIKESTPSPQEASSSSPAKETALQPSEQDPAPLSPIEQTVPKESTPTTKEPSQPSYAQKAAARPSKQDSTPPSPLKQTATKSSTSSELGPSPTKSEDNAHGQLRPSEWVTDIDRHSIPTAVNAGLEDQPVKGSRAVYHPGEGDFGDDDLAESSRGFLQVPSASSAAAGRRKADDDDWERVELKEVPQE